jgi:hypothetical protein
MSWRWAFAALALSQVAGAQSQSTWSDEIRVGSDRELYLRALSLATGNAIPWESRPFAPATSAGLIADLPAWAPWSTTGDSRPVRLLRPATTATLNRSFPWQYQGAEAWNGRGLNEVASAGVAANRSVFSARLQMNLSYAANRPFEPENPASPFRDPLRNNTIDEPPRFGSSALAVGDLGESFVRADVRNLAVGYSDERIFWGPGVRQAILFTTDAPQFPHLFLGTGHPYETVVGGLYAQLLYGALQQSSWSPTQESPRFGSGVLAAWHVRAVPLTLGVARFYHRPWPSGFGAHELFAPFGSLLYDAQKFAGAGADNQLATAFFSARAPRARLEVFGEFARNDRSAGLRDLAVEPEHNSAWLLGMLHTFAVDTLARTFWSIRYEAANGRIGAIQQIPRHQVTFFEHASVRQGHTQLGRLLGTPLIDRSGGSDLGIDHWSAHGRTGFGLLQRQMPPDELVGMPKDQARTQWDLKFLGVRFIGHNELSWQVGHVWDLDRYPGRDAGNLYLSLGWRQQLRG